MGDATQVRTVIVSRDSPKTLERTSSATPVAQAPGEITPEIVAVIQAAANEFLGKQVRILSIKILPDSNRDPGRWLQRGRDTLQASHNLVQQRR
jgi:hypothetical protein